MPESGVMVIEQSPDAVVEYNLDNWPEAEWNRLVPTQTLGLGTDLIRPIVQAVRLEIERDTYKSNDIPEGYRAPNARGLSKLAAAAGVDFVDEERLDDGKDPGRAYVRVYAEMIDATGRKRRAPGSRDYVLDSQQMTDAQRRRAKAFVHENAATRARHRALRALLSLPQAYTIAELQKPFAVVSFVPNLQNQQLRDRVIDAMVPTIAALYGPAQAKQLEAGPVEVPEVPDEPRNVTPAAPTPTVLPGEKLAAAAKPAELEEPEWMRSSEAAQPVAAAKPAKVDFATSIRDSAAAGGDELASAEDFAQLREIFTGWDGRLVGAGIHVLFDDEDGPQEPNRLSAGQVHAIATAHESLGHAKFEAAWRSLVDASTRAAA